MKELLWYIFEKSGNIFAFMAYKEYENNQKNVINNKG